jgi:capsular polysaccharide transport system permease protein
MNESFFRALAVQGRVIWALSLREIHGKHGKARLGYLWAILKQLLGIGIFWGIRELAGMKAPQGLPTGLFLLLGFAIWHIFSATVKTGLRIVQRNKSLLTFPQVLPLDLFLGNLVTVWVTEVIVAGLFLLGLHSAGYQFHLYDPLTFFLTLLGIAFFSLGVSLVLAALVARLQFLEQIIPIGMRMLFFTSGVFFSPSQMTKHFGDAVLWNPLVNFIELMRGTFVYMTPGSNIKILYITAFSCLAMLFGLLLERHTRLKWATA